MIREILDELNFKGPEHTEEHESGLIDSEDCEVLLHRDIHFGGQFSVMLEYYEMGGKGAVLEIRHVERLSHMQDQMGTDLAPVLLSGADAELVNKSRELYQKLRDLYENDRPEASHARLIADLILSEDEDEDEAVEACVQAGGTVVPELIHLLNSEHFTNPLYPGYGFAPGLAARALGAIKDERAIRPLFEAIGSDNIDFEEEVLDALGAMGEPAITFCHTILSGDQLSQDTERAAMVLALFEPSEQSKTLAAKWLAKDNLPETTREYLTCIVAGN